MTDNVAKANSWWAWLHILCRPRHDFGASLVDIPQQNWQSCSLKSLGGVADLSAYTRTLQRMKSITWRSKESVLTRPHLSLYLIYLFSNRGWYTDGLYPTQGLVLAIGQKYHQIRVKEWSEGASAYWLKFHPSFNCILDTSQSQHLSFLRVVKLARPALLILVLESLRTSSL